MNMSDYIFQQYLILYLIFGQYILSDLAYSTIKYMISLYNVPNNL